jgi:hypothetical protein
MSIFLVTGARLNNQGRVIDVTIHDNRPYEMAASDVASKIRCGEKYRGYFEVDGSMIPGPHFRAVTYEHGHEGIVLEEDGRFSIHDLCTRHE